LDVVTEVKAPVTEPCDVSADLGVKRYRMSCDKSEPDYPKTALIDNYLSFRVILEDYNGDKDDKNGKKVSGLKFFADD
jgi:hypothetical protein